MGSFRKLVARILSTKDQGFCCASGKLVFVRGCDGRWTKSDVKPMGDASYLLATGRRLPETA